MRISIFTKLALTSLLIIAGLVSFFAYRTNHELDKNFAELVRDREERVESGIGLEVKLLLDGLETQLREISIDKELPLRLVEYQPEDPTQSSRLINRTVEIRDISGIQRLWIVSPDGKLLATGHNPNMFGDDLLKPAGTYSGRIVRALNKETVKTVAIETVATETLFIAEVFLPVLNYDSLLGREQVDGIIWGGVIIDNAFISRAADLAGAELIVTAPNVEPLSSLSENELISASEILRLLSGSTGEIHIGKESYAVTSLPFPGTEATDSESQVRLYLLVPKTDLNTRRIALLRTLLIDSVFGGFVAILLVFLIAKSITLPIERLKDAVADIAAGNLNRRVDVQSRDEVEDLVRAFNSMADDLDANTRRLVEAEKLSAWREVARRLAHEIKNPLSPIKLSIQQLMRIYPANPPDFNVTLSETGKTILEEVDRLKTLADEFSNFARMPKPVMVPADLGEIVKSAAALYDQPDSGIKISLDIPDTLPKVNIDRDAISRVFTNLIKNAHESMEGMNGTIRIIVSHISRGNKKWIQVKVIDEGIGMDEKSLKQIFNPYFTTKKGGSGLGLAIVQSIIADHGGRIRIASEPQKGTMVTVELPV